MDTTVVTPLADSLGKATLPTICALLILAVAWLVKTLLAQQKENAAQVAALNEARLKDMATANEARLGTAMQVIPLSSKLADCVGVMERVTAALVSARTGA